MRKCFFAIGIVVTAVTIALPSLPLGAESQDEYGTSTDQPKAHAKAHTPAKAGHIKRLPDGQPDITGTWTKEGGDLNDAKPPKSPLVGFGVLAEPQGFGQGPRAAGPGGRAEVLRRPKHEPNPAPPTGIVDPPDRVLPWHPEALARQSKYAAEMCCPAPSFDHLEITMRCTPPAPWADRGSMEIMQRPGQVVLFSETNHSSRVIYTDGRPHLSPNMRFFGGDSIGRWEGDTLVVDTTNLNELGSFSRAFQKVSDAMHLTERFTPVSDKLILYEITYDDPKLFTRPIKSVGYFFPTDESEETVEVSCHEGSYTMKNLFGF